MRRLLLFILLSAVIMGGCRKEAGEGGTSSISGKVWVLDYNAEFTHLNARYYGTEEDVYIVYGNDAVYSRSFKTSYDGTYQFDHLQKGKYKVFCYSKDTTGMIPGGIFAVIRDVEITANRQKIIVDDLVIVK